MHRHGFGGSFGIGSAFAEGCIMSIYLCLMLTCVMAIALPRMAYAADSASSGNPLGMDAPPVDDPTEGTEPLHILFVGNSFTRYPTYNVGVVDELDAIARANGKQMDIDYVVYGFSSLAEYATPVAGREQRYRAFEKKLAQTAPAWDYIVLQENSKLAAYGPVTAYRSARALVERINECQPDAKIVLYMTHGYNYVDCKTSALFNGVKKRPNASDDQAYVQGSYSYVSDALGLDVVPVGASFNKINESASSYLPDGIGLVMADNKHPSKLGYFIAACMFYRSFFGEAPALTEETFGGVKGACANVGIAAPEDISQFLDPVLEMAPASMALAVGSSATVSCEPGEPGGAYRSLDPGIAAVTLDGEVTGVSEGTTVVVYEDGEHNRGTCLVSVESDELLSQRILFDEEVAPMTVGDTIALKPKASVALGAYSLTWESSATNVASVNKLGVVTAKKAGTATITVTDSLTNTSAPCLIRVKLKKPAKPTLKRWMIHRDGKVVPVLKASWSKVYRAKQYAVYRAVGSGSFKRVATIAGTSYLDKTLAADKKASYRVVAIADDKSMNSSYSSIASGIALSTPENLKVSGKKRRIKLSWGKNSSADGYRIYRATKTGVFGLVKTIKSKKTLTWSDWGVKRGKTYRYKVRSYKKIGGRTYLSNCTVVKSARVR